MFDFRSIPCSPPLQFLISRFIIFQGQLPPGMVWTHPLLPAEKEMMFFCLGDPQLFTVPKGEVILKDCTIAAQYSLPFYAHLSGNVRLIGIEFQMPSLCQLFSIPMHYISDTGVSLEDIIGKEA